MSGNVEDDNSKQKKKAYFGKLVSLLEQYPRILIVTCDNIGSSHMQDIRKKLRGKGAMLMGKNTMMRKAIRDNGARNPLWSGILSHIWGNVGLVFTDNKLKEVKNILLDTKVPAAAKVGTLAPQDVIIPKGLTQLEPTKTSFLQALNIASKINRGTIEILQDVHLIKAGDKVGSSEATLLQMLDIRPFTYCVKVNVVYDNGVVYDASVLDMPDEAIAAKFASGLANVAGLCMAIHYPTIASFPHAVVNGFKNLVAISLQTEFSFKQADKLKEMAKNPAAYAAPVATPAAAPAKDTKKDEEKKDDKKAKEEKKKEEKKASSGEGMGFDLFG